MSSENKKILSLLMEISEIAANGIATIHYGRSNNLTFKRSPKRYDVFRMAVESIADKSEQLLVIAPHLRDLCGRCAGMRDLVRSRPQNDGYYHLSRDEIDNITRGFNLIHTFCNQSAEPLRTRIGMAKLGGV